MYRFINCTRIYHRASRLRWYKRCRAVYEALKVIYIDVLHEIHWSPRTRVQRARGQHPGRWRRSYRCIRCMLLIQHIRLGCRLRAYLPQELFVLLLHPVL